MWFRGRLAVLCVALAGCGFNPSGGEVGDDDDLPPLDDGGDGDPDAARTDGPTLPIDAVPAAVDAAVDARPPCPAAYTTVIGSSRYVLRTGLANIAAARTDCGDDLAGRTALATFENATDLQAVLENLAGSEAQPWVGAKCAYTTFGCEGAASWTWDSGGAVATNLWAVAEPDAPFTDTSANAVRRSGTWSLASTGVFPLEGRPYVCECSN